MGSVVVIGMLECISSTLNDSWLSTTSISMRCHNQLEMSWACCRHCCAAMCHPVERTTCDSWACSFERAH